jgi:lysophospholipase L1-like esterase|tara:strand:+ start:5410 stop:6186 length:777 start_codon:yes stop_codon:yes gene_type:complete
MNKLLFVLLFVTLVSCSGEDVESTSLDTVATEDPSEVQETQPNHTVTFGERNDNSFNQIRYLALGDSYTIGSGVELSESWPYKLSELISKKKSEEVYSKVIARHGITTGELSLLLENKLVEDKFNLISIQVGVNDQFKGNTSDQFAEKFAELISNIKALDSLRSALIFVVSIPDWGSTPFGINFDQNKISSEIDLFNRTLRRLCNTYNIKFINITDISRISPTDYTLVTNDGLHPSGKMYSLWIDKILPVIDSLIVVN